MLTQNVHGGSVFMESRHNWSCIAGFSRMVGGVIEPWIKNVPSEPPSSALGRKVEDNIESVSCITSYFCNYSLQKILFSGFHTHLLVYPFVYQFYTRMTAQVESTFWKSSKLFIFIAFHNHFKIYFLSCYWKWEASFDSIYFEVQKNHN